MSQTETKTQTTEQSPFKIHLNKRKVEIEDALWSLLPKPEGMAAKLHEAMIYPLEAGGKRIRPFLVLTGCDFSRHISGKDVYDGNSWQEIDKELKQAILRVACSVELVHTYSLVHDDLPCMDDDDLRRGRPTAHIKFGEAMAVLSADGLHTLGFQLITSISEKYSLEAMRVAHDLAVACGYPGMVAGQAVDLEYETKQGNEAVLDYIHLHKTAALIRASLLMGAHMVSASNEDVQLLSDVGMKLGLIFQVVDDILDVVGDTDVIGKETGSDEAKGKLTYPALIGLDESKKRVDDLKEDILSQLNQHGERAAVLIDLTNELVNRKY
jgi:geranylgeranyl diphosphate synthase type II